MMGAISREVNWLNARGTSSCVGRIPPSLVAAAKRLPVVAHFREVIESVVLRQTHGGDQSKGGVKTSGSILCHT